MNTKNLLISSLVGGLVITVLANVPILNFINCLLCAGFWGGAVLAVWLYRRQSGSMTLGQAVGVGALSGLFAGVIGFLLSFTGLTGAQALLDSYAQFAPPDAELTRRCRLSRRRRNCHQLHGCVDKHRLRRHRRADRRRHLQDPDTGSTYNRVDLRSSRRAPRARLHGEPVPFFRHPQPSYNEPRIGQPKCLAPGMGTPTAGCRSDPANPWQGLRSAQIRPPGPHPHPNPANHRWRRLRLTPGVLGTDSPH